MEEPPFTAVPPPSHRVHLIILGETASKANSRQLVMVSGHPPIQAKKIRYYADANFTGRVLPPPVLTESGFTDSPAARPNDWSGQLALFADQSSALLSSGLPTGSDLPALTPRTRTDVGLLDDDSATASRPAALKASRTARMAALDPNDGISL